MIGYNPTSLTFRSQTVGTISATQVVALTSTGDDGLKITQIAVSGDFAQTNNCPASLLAGNSCQISVAFTPTAIGNRVGTLSVVDNAPGSPQTVSLSGTGVAPVATVNPTSLTFTSQTVGTTSVAQVVALTNTGNDALNITQIAVSGDFAQTNNCPASLLAGNSCQISLAFTPTAIGNRVGTLTIVDNAPGSPHTASLVGVGNSLGFGVASSGTSSATVQAGGTASYFLSIGGAGLGGQASLNCAGAPIGASCMVSSPVSVDGTSAMEFTITVTTAPRTLAVLTPGQSRRVLWLWGVAIMGVVMLPGSRGRKRLTLRCVPFLLVLLLCSCGGSNESASGQLNPSGTPAGTYDLSVTATLGSVNQSLSLTLIVK